MPHSKGSGSYADLFPMIRHANRTTGFFKVRGVNVNHAEFEDLMFRHAEVLDFQAVLVPAGEHDVVLSYRPAVVPVGLAVSGVVAAVILAMVVLGWRRRRGLVTESARG